MYRLLNFLVPIGSFSSSFFGKSDSVKNLTCFTFQSTPVP